MKRFSQRLVVVLVVVLLAAWSRWRSPPAAPGPAPGSPPAATDVREESGSASVESSPADESLGGGDVPEYSSPDVASGASGQDARAAAPAAERESPPSRPRTVFPAMRIRDLQGRIVFRGDVDVAETLARIDAQKRLPFPNDGTVFRNREGLLPRRPAGHYREWVHPTPGIRGPGPQRIVTGEAGEAFYTPDHYQSFQRVR